MGTRFIIGDSLTVLRSLPDQSVDLILTSPPFLALRSYLPADHPDKSKEMGSEATPGEFIDALLDIIEECERVLAPHGSIAIELGDTYAGSGGSGGDYTAGGMKEGQSEFVGTSSLNRTMGKNARVQRDGESSPIRDLHGKKQGGGVGWPLDKSLSLIPELFRIALVYGFNPLTGRETPRWRVRNVVRWVRPNPPVGALGDKFRPATSEMVIACKSRKRYFDLDAVREPASENTNARTAKGVESRVSSGKTADDERRGGNYSSLDTLHKTTSAPPLDWWSIPPTGYSGSHYAVFPAELLTRPIKAMCPEKVCRTCGEPSTRISETSYEGKSWSSGGQKNGLSRQRDRIDMPYSGTTTGWTDCGHDDYRPGVVLDPFVGSGTTLMVASGHGRDSIGIDLDERNADLARERVGMFLTVEQHGQAAA